MPTLERLLTKAQKDHLIRARTMVLWRMTGMSYAQIAERYGISKERCRQVILKTERDDAWRKKVRPKR